MFAVRTFVVVVLCCLAVAEGCVFSNTTKTCIEDGVTVSGVKVPAADIVNPRPGPVKSFNKPDADRGDTELPRDGLPYDTYSVETRNMQLYDGNVFSISAWVESGNAGSSTQYSNAISHTFSMSGNVNLAGGIDNIITNTFKLNVGITWSYTYQYGKTSTVAHTVNFDHNSLARLLFKPKIMKVWGTMLKTEHNYDGPFKPPRRVRQNYEIHTTVETGGGTADGTFFTEYRGTNRWTHDRFFNIFNKDVPKWDSWVEWNVRSPAHCGELALQHDKNLAVYRPQFMGCWLKDVQWAYGWHYGGDGRYLGHYDVAEFDSDNTWDKGTRNGWVQNRRCDTIHDGQDGHYWCKVYPSVGDAVIIHRYNS